MTDNKQENTINKTIYEVFDKLKTLECDIEALTYILRSGDMCGMCPEDQVIKYKARERYLLHVFDQMLKRSKSIMECVEQDALNFDTACFSYASEIHEYLTAVYNENNKTFKFGCAR